jgi:hypothetical protein
MASKSPVPASEQQKAGFRKLAVSFFAIAAKRIGRARCC